MAKKILHIGAGYNGKMTVFHLRAISVAEDNRYSARFLEISPSESEERKAELEYDIFVDSLASWSDAAPTQRMLVGQNEAGGTSNAEVELFPDAPTPADAVRQFFAERDPETERLAPAIIGRYRTKLQPEVVFY